jgi:hypothetical protein
VGMQVRFAELPHSSGYSTWAQTSRRVRVCVRFPPSAGRRDPDVGGGG